MIQDFTFFFFANITASYVNRRRKKQTRKIKQNKIRGQNGVQDHFKSYILLHSLGILNMSYCKCTQTRYSKQNTHSKQRTIMWLWEKKKGVRVDENDREGREREVFPNKYMRAPDTFPLDSGLFLWIQDHINWCQEVTASFIGAPRVEGVLPFIGDYKWQIYGSK